LSSCFQKIAANGGGGGFDLETGNLQLLCGGEEEKKKWGLLDPRNTIILI
jgi:hypothetical protein